MSDEVSLAATIAAVYSYESNQWASLDGGLSKVFIFHNTVANVYRVIGMSTKDEQFILNTEIFKDLLHQKASAIFLQWKDQAGKIFGLNFRSAEEMNSFVSMMENVVSVLQHKEDPVIDTLPPPVESLDSYDPNAIDLPPVDSDVVAPVGQLQNLSMNVKPTPVQPVIQPSNPGSVQNQSTSRPGSGVFRQPPPVPITPSLRPGVTSNNPPPSNQATPVNSDASSEYRNYNQAQAQAALQHLAAVSNKRSSLNMNDDIKGSGDLSSSSESSRKTFGKNTPTGAIKEALASSGDEPSKKDRAGTLKILGKFNTLGRKNSKRDAKKEDEAPALNSSSSIYTLSPKLVTCEVEGLSPRDLIVREIYTTESTYIRQLNDINNNFIIPATQASIFTPDEIKSIFSNVLTILGVNKNLLDELFRPLNDWGPTTQIGSIFVKMLPFFLVYQTYCNNYESALRNLEELKNKKSAVAAFLKANEQPVTLQSLLITPVQRLPRYLLLLKELQKKTPPTHVDSADISQAVEKLGETVEQLNLKIKKSASAKLFAEILKEKAKFIGLENLVAPTREFMERGKVTCNQVEHIYLVFNDLLALATTDPQTQIKTVKEKINLEFLWVQTFSGYLELVTPDQTLVLTDVPNDLQNILTSSIEACVAKANRGDYSKRNFKHTFSKGENVGSTYVGDFVSGKMTGNGVLTTSDGNTFSGVWNDGKLNGDKGTAVYNDGSDYKGSWKDGAPHKNGIYKSPFGKYNGSWEAGKKHGEGSAEWINGDKYTGEWSNDMLNGKGEFTGADGASYVGMWKLNKRQGEGVFISPHGWKYNGEWDANVRHGEGEISYSNGDTYKGSWKYEKRHGQGTFNNAKLKIKYVGAWIDDKMEGQGNYSCPQYEYNGSWKEGKRSGQGVCTYHDGSKYEGEWKEDRREGQGVWTSSRGEKYSGNWKDDKRNGRGKYEDPESGSYDGAWVNDKKEGTGIIFYKNGDSYMGPWKNDQRHGEGVYTKANSLGKYAGGWVENVKSGKGTLKDLEGSYDGDWLNNMKNGEGTFTTTSGDVYKGRWKDDKKHGKFTIKRGPVTTEAEYADGLAKSTDFKRVPPELHNPVFFS